MLWLLAVEKCTGGREAPIGHKCEHGASCSPLQDWTSNHQNYFWTITLSTHLAPSWNWHTSLSAQSIQDPIHVMLSTAEKKNTHALEHYNAVPKVHRIMGHKKSGA